MYKSTIYKFIEKRVPLKNRLNLYKRYWNKVLWKQIWTSYIE